MGILDLFRRRAEPEVERRSSGFGYTAEIIRAREGYISGTTATGELTATVQACVSLWEGALASANVAGTAICWTGAAWRSWRALWRSAARPCS
jgi:hypothetical protein